MLDNSESVGDRSDLFEVFDAQAKIYTRKAAPMGLSVNLGPEQNLRESKAQLERAVIMSQLQTLSRQLFTSFDLDQASLEMLETAITTLCASMGNIQLYRLERGMLEIAVQRGFGQGLLHSFREVRIDNDSASSRALKTGGRVIIEDVQTAPEYEPYRQIAATAGYRAVQSTPLIDRNGAMWGLDLYLVCSIMEAHSGDVEAESSGELQGATYVLTLPKAAEPVQSSAPTSLKTEISLEDLRILVVEDSEDTLWMFTLFLEGLGAIVSTAQTAAEALVTIAEQPLDILISDIGLPDINGYELMRQVRALPAEQGGCLSAIALTGYVSEQDAQAAIEAGFQLHLAKPIDFQDLEAAIHRLIQA